MVESADLTTPTWTGPKPSGESPLGDGLVTADVVAAYLCVDVSTVYKLATAGTLPVVAIGRAKRFRVADLVAFVENATRGGRSARIDRVQQLLHGVARDACTPRSNDLDAPRRQSVHRAPKQEPWRVPGPQENN